MFAAAVRALWHRAHLYKILLVVVFMLIGLQYLISSVLDRHSLETIFAVKTSRFLDHSYHPKGLIIYGRITPSYLVTNVSTTTASAVVAQGNFSKPELISTMVSTNKTALPPTRNVSSVNTTDNSFLQQCPSYPPNLVGPLKVELSPPEMPEMEKIFAEVKPGGWGSPDDCTPKYRVAIIIPFRDRLQHLHTLLYNLHPVLLRQQIDYQIFVIEEKGETTFNRATLMNVGFVEALKERDFDCFVFHDVDLMPENDKNLYTCPDQPRHMSVAVDKFKYRLPYADLFGGVSALTKEHFRLVNGFSNAFWGWGGEDDDMANRIKAHGLHISRYPANVARYKMLTHKKEKANPKRYENLKTGKKRFATDGLSNLQYELVDKKKAKLYTWLLVKLTPPQPS